MNRRFLEGVLMYTVLFLVMFLTVRELDAISREREQKMEKKENLYARLYVNAKPFEHWLETTPEGELVRYTLHTAYRAGVIQWVLREGGHYVEGGSMEEFTIDRELPFEEGMTLLHTKRAQIDATSEWIE